MKNVGRVMLPLMILAFAFLFSAAVSSAQVNPNRRAEKLSQEARDYFYKENYKKAIENSDKAIKAQPRFAYAYYIKGWSQFRLGFFQQALLSLNTALEQGHDKTEVFEPRGEVYYFLKDYANAEVDLLEFTRSPKGNGEANFILGRTFFDQQKYQFALPRFQQAAAMAYQNRDIQYYLAVCHGAVGDRPAQEKAARAAIQSDTQFKSESYYQAASALFYQKKYEDAIVDYEKAIGLQPSDKAPYLDLYRSYRLLNREKEAMATMKRLIRQDPNDVQAYLNLSWIASLADEPNEAVEAARQATKLEPKQSIGFTNMCRAYNDLELYDSAVQACNDALKIKPGDGETFLYLARAKDKQNKSNEATLYFEKAVTGLIEYTRQFPDNADGHYLLGNAQYAVGQRNRAIAAYLKALELNPRYVKARFNLGYIYAQSGDLKSARAQYDLLAVLDPGLAARLLPSIEKPSK